MLCVSIVMSEVQQQRCMFCLLVARNPDLDVMMVWFAGDCHHHSYITLHKGGDMKQQGSGIITHRTILKGNFYINCYLFFSFCIVSL